MGKGKNFEGWVDISEYIICLYENGHIAQVNIIKTFYREPALPYLQQINLFVQLQYTLESSFNS